MKIWKYAHDIQAVIHQHCALAADVGEDRQLEVCQSFNRAMAEACYRHKREIDLAENQSIEPVVHMAEAVVEGKGQ